MTFSVLLAGSNNGLLSNLDKIFETNKISTLWAQSGKEALLAVSRNDFDLLVADEKLKDWTGKSLIEKVIVMKPQTNCVAVSSLTHKDFHEKFEGLGVLMQLSEDSNQNDFEKLISLARQIIQMNRK